MRSNLPKGITIAAGSPSEGRFLTVARPVFISLWLAVFTLFGSIWSVDAQEINTELRLALQRNYSNWKRAMVAKDLRGWSAHTSRFRQTMTRNLIVSQKRDYPRSVFAVPIHPPEVDLLRLIEAKSSGDVGRLVYFGKVDFRVSDTVPPDSLLMLYFLREKGLWKFDRSRYFSLQHNERVAGMARNGNLEFLSDADFAMPKKAPAVPRLCPPPYYIGKIRIRSTGYRTEVDFNGFHKTVVDDTTSTEVLIGGIKKGPNALKLKVAPSAEVSGDDVSIRHLEVEVFVNTPDPKRKHARVFHLNPGSRVQTEYDLQVWANAVTMQERR